MALYGDREAAEASRDLGAALHVLFHPSAKGKPPADAADAPVRPVPGAAGELRRPAGAGGRRGERPRRAGADPPGDRLSNSARAAPHTPVLLDWDGDLGRRFGLVAGEPNAVVISADGVGYPIDVRRDGAAERVAAVVEALRRRMLTTR